LEARKEEGVALYLNEMTSCAIQEIVGLSDYTKPEEAMQKFFHLFYVTGKNKYAWQTLGGHYVFVGVEKITDDEDDASVGYAEPFYQLIRTEGLGEVKKGPLAVSRPYHLNHLVRCYLWSPDEAALQAWGKKHYTLKKDESFSFK
jgi:hypothetical protein